MTEGVSKLTYALVAFVFGALVTAAAFKFAVPANLNSVVIDTTTVGERSSYVPSVPEYQKSAREAPSKSIGQVEKAMSLDEMLQLSSDFDQTAALYVRLAGAEEEDVLDLLENSKSIDRISDRRGAQRIIFSRLAAINPKIALERLKDFRFTQKYGLIQAIFHEWSRSDLSSAAEAAKRLPASQKRYVLQIILSSRDDLDSAQREELIREFGGPQSEYLLAYTSSSSRLHDLDDDPAVAWQQLTSESNNNPAAFNSLMDVAVSWAERDGIDVLDQIGDSLTNLQQRSMVLSSVIQVLAYDDPQGVLTYLQRMPQNSDTQRMSSMVFSSWAEVDPTAAFSAAKELDRTNSSYQNRQAVLQHWASRDPEAVLKLVDSLPAELQVTSYRMAMMAVAQESPRRAADLIDSIEDSQVRRELVGQLANQWTISDPRGAIEWILSQPTDIQDSSALVNAVSHLAEGDPEEAFRLASRQSGRMREAMEVGVIRTLAARDVDRAIALLSRTRPEGRVEAAVEIGSQLVSYDTDRALRLASTLKDEQQDEYFNSLVRRWVYREPYTLIRTIGDLPSGDVQSNAAKMLLQQRGRRSSLTEEQHASLYSRLNENDKETIDNMQNRTDGRPFGRGGRVLRF